MEWCHHNHRRQINKSKCVGILHAHFINDEEVYIIALSGTGYKLDNQSSDDIQLQITSYNTAWKELKNKMANNEKIAEFDAVHKACLVKYTGENKDQKFFQEWKRRLKNWISEWHKLYNKNKETLNFTITRFVEQGVKEAYFEQMKVEALSVEEAEQRCKDVVDFLVYCIPKYEEVPLRMKILEILFTKNPDEIRHWFDKELKTQLSQFKTDFERLCSEFMSHYRLLLICWDVSCVKRHHVDAIIDVKIRGGVHLAMPARNFRTFFQQYSNYWQKIGELLWTEYMKEYYRTNKLPQGYTTVSMIWGGILVIIAEFDAVHKAFLVKYTGENKDQKFFEEWKNRFKNWMGEWHKKTKSVTRYVEQGMKDTYLEQMTVETPSVEEAELRFKDVVDFLVDCKPEVPLRMKINEILFTKNPDEIRRWFDKKLEIQLNQFKTGFERLCSEFMSRYRPLLICWDVSCTNLVIHTKTRDVDLAMPADDLRTYFQCCSNYWQKISELLCTEYIKEYDETYQLPKGYERVSWIWGGIVPTKNPHEIRRRFHNELKTQLSQFKTGFERLCSKFMSRYRPLLICLDVSYANKINLIHNMKTRGVDLAMPADDFRTYFQRCSDYWQKIGDLLWTEYKKEYDGTNQLPKGYTTVSMIWGGILQGGFKYNTGIANFFIQCAEDNALCTLVSYIEEHKLENKCKKVSWHAFQYENKCEKGECKDTGCKSDKCKGKNFDCYSIKHKPLCAFCKHTFIPRVTQAIDINEQDIHIEDDEDEEDSSFSYGILSYRNYNQKS